MGELIESLPAGGAWIEIKLGNQMGAALSSLPAGGAWIEIIEGVDYTLEGNVAPRRGSVD